MRFNQNLSNAKLEGLLELFSSAGFDGFTRTAQNEVSVINYRSDKTGVLDVDDETFIRSLESIRSDLERAGMVEAKRFWSEGEYGYEHDWAKDPQGAAILDHGGITGRPDLQAWIRHRRGAFEDLLAQYSDDNLKLRQQDAETGKVFLSRRDMTGADSVPAGGAR